MASERIPFTLWMAYCCPALSGESFEAWQNRAMAEYTLGPPDILPECRFFASEGAGGGLKPNPDVPG